MVGGMCGGGHAWWGTCGQGAYMVGGMCGRGACIAGGMHGGGQGACVARGGMHGRGMHGGGMHGRGHVWCGGGVCVADTTRYGQ